MISDQKGTTMKKILAYVLAVLMVFSAVSAVAENPESTADDLPAQEPETEAVELPGAADDETHLTVGTATPMTGNFFSSMWSNNTSDLDVRLLIHGYNLVEWRNTDSGFVVNPSVVSGITVKQNASGDRTYILTLYQDLYYSDGTPVTAWDYAFSFLLGCAPEIREIGGNMRPMEYLLGYQDYANGVTDTLAGVRVLGDHELAVRVSGEYLPYFYELSLLDCVPYPISVLAPGCSVRDDGDGAYITPKENFTAEVLNRTILDPETGYMTHPSVTGGPYRLVSFANGTAELEINEYYKRNADDPHPAIPRITFGSIPSDEMAARFAAGDVTLLNKVMDADAAAELLALVDRDSSLTDSSYRRSGLGYIAFCCERPTVGSPAVRQAISLCVDKDALIRETMGGFAVRTDGYYGEGQWPVLLLNGTIERPAKDAAAWGGLSLNQVRKYEKDTAAAAALLEADGWTLNQDGEPFDAARDSIRCKQVDGELVALDLTMMYPEENARIAALQEFLGDALREAGIGFTLDARPTAEVLSCFYRQQPRDCDMIFMASNFDVAFDPAVNFRPDSEQINYSNFSAVGDEELYRLAVDMRRTEPGDVTGYVRKWLAFQDRFQEVVPAIPLYTNEYYDFYPRALQNYEITGALSWSEAIVDAYMSGAADQAGD